MCKNHEHFFSKMGSYILSDDGNTLKVRHYYIDFKIPESLIAFQQVMVMRSETENDIPILQSNTTYLFRVFARSDNGNGRISNLFPATTLRQGHVNATVLFVLFSTSIH